MEPSDRPAGPGRDGTRPEDVSAPDPGRERWRATLRAKAVADSPERRARFVSTSGIEYRDLYTPADVAGLDEERDLGRPGEYPFTRGVQPTMYRGRLWTMRQYAGFGTAEETNARFRYLLEQGQTGLSVAFDLPTQMGYDSDAPESLGEVGRVGVPIDSLADMETLFAGIPLGDVSTSMTINSTAAILLALYVAAAEKQGVERGRISGTTQNDILKEYIARGTYIYPPRPSMRLVTDIFEFATRELPRWNTISISGYHMREAGATAAQELAFTMADAIAYVEAAVRAGLDVDAFAGRLSFFFASWSELFEEVAKFRAARRMWATDREGALRRIEHAFYGVPVPRADRRFQPHGDIDRQQRGTYHSAGARGRPGRGAEPPHELPRRGARAPDRGGRPAGPADPAGHRVRGRGHRDPRPARRQLPRGDADGPGRDGGVATARRDRRDGGDARRDRGRLPAAADPGVGIHHAARDRARARRSSSGSTRTATRSTRAPRPSASTRPGSRRRSSGSGRCGPSEIPPPGRRRCVASRTLRVGTRTSCRRSWRRSTPTRRSARSATGCAPSGASTAST